MIKNIVHFLLFIFLFYLELITFVICWQGICEMFGLIDVGASTNDGSCTYSNSMPQSDRCCITSPCEVIGLVDIGAGMAGACDGIATYLEGRCCTTSTITTTSTPTTTLSTTKVPTTTIVTTTKSSKLCLYKNNNFYMYCNDTEAPSYCQKNLIKCILLKNEMAYKCCYSCYLAFPNYLPKYTGSNKGKDCGNNENNTKENNCVDKFPISCNYWVNEKTTNWCKNSARFGNKMRENCKKSCKECSGN